MNLTPLQLLINWRLLQINWTAMWYLKPRWMTLKRQLHKRLVTFHYLHRKWLWWNALFAELCAWNCKKWLTHLTLSNLSVQAVETAFTNGVEALCKNPALSVEVTSEVQLVATAVAFAQSAIYSIPSLKNKVLGAAQSFLHSRTDKWVSQQGGWVSTSWPFVQTFSSRKLAVEVWLVISWGVSHWPGQSLCCWLLANQNIINEWMN